MADRVELAERQDGLYAVWRDRVFLSQRSTADNSVLLVVLPDEEPPEDFDTEWNLRPAKVVPEVEVSATFSLQTLCVFDDDVYRIVSSAPNTLRWTGQDEHMARQLGLVDFTTTANPARLTALWQQRHDFATSYVPPESTRSEEPESVDQQAELTQKISQTLSQGTPSSASGVVVRFRQVGGYAEIDMHTVDGADIVFHQPPAPLSQLFTRLRSVMYQRKVGTWLQCTFTLDKVSGQYDLQCDRDTEPSWRQVPNEDGRAVTHPFRAELDQFPRDRSHIPDWLAKRIGLALDVHFRHAKVPSKRSNDGANTPIDEQDLPRILNYLYRSPVIAVSPQRQVDIFQPDAPPDVPDAFHTDGAWIWPAAIPHYLRKHRIPPEAELLDHIKTNEFHIPFVDKLLRDTAEAEVLGQPYPLPSEDDPSTPDPVALVDRGERPSESLRASETLAVLTHRLTEYGIGEDIYRIGESASGVWSLYRGESGWLVQDPNGQQPAEFSTVEEASRFLLGTLLLYPSNTPERAGELEWPILPIRGEPPLRLFRNKRIVLLPRGKTVLRFGNEAGNLVHEDNAKFIETALTPERERDRRRYRILRDVHVLAGIMRPWGPMQGGAVGYLLPQPIAQHLQSGTLEQA